MAGVLSSLQILLHANTAQFRAGITDAARHAGSELGKMQQKAAVVAKGMGIAFAAVTGAAAGLAAVIVPVQRQFDIMNGQLVTATGSAENAAHAMEALNKFAAQTPYDLEQSVIGFTKLVNLGLTPSERAMTSYGNTASAMGKSMEQMIEAVADAATGEFERLKEFGIKASKEGDRVTFTFRGVKTEIGNSAAEIEKYLMGIGEVEFAGAMEAQMDTLNGRISQSEIAMNDLKLAIAQSGIGDILKSAVEEANERLGQMTDFIRSPEFNGALSILASTFAGFEKNGKESINAVENKLGGALGDMNTANNKTLVNMADDWAEWSSATIAAVSTAVVVSVGELDKLAIAAQTIWRLANSNFFTVRGVYGEYEKRMAASTANAARLQSIVDKRFDAQTSARIKANQEAAAAIDALKNKTAETGDQLARYGIAANAQQEKSVENTKKKAAAEKALAKQREKEHRDRLRQMEEQNRKLQADIDFIRGIRGEYDPFVKLELDFKKRWLDIQSAMVGSSEEALQAVWRQEERLLAQADVQEQVRQDRRLQAYSEFIDDKRTKIIRYYQQEAELAQSAFDLNAKQQEAAQILLMEQRNQELASFQEEIDRRVIGILSHETDEITKLLAETELELRALNRENDLNAVDKARIEKAIKSRTDYELEQILFVRAKELVMATDHQKTELQLIKQRYDFERKEIEITRNLTDDVRQAKIDAVNAKEAKAAFDLRNTANNAYQAQRADLGGYGADYALKQQFGDRLKIIQDAMDAELLTEQAALDAKLEARRAYEAASNDLALSSAEGIAGSLSSITKTMMGENSTAYRAMFAIEKGVAIARSIMNIQVAMSSAAASLPFPANLGAMATVAANVASIVGNIQAVRMPAVQGQAHDGLDYVPHEGTWMLDKGERVVRPADNRKLSDFLDNNAKQGGGIKINITNNAPVDISTTTNDDGSIEMRIDKRLNQRLPQAMAQQISNPYSATNDALKQNYHLQRKL